MTLLAIESSCDETSAAVILDGVVLSNVVATQTTLHAEYGGVVPELATREHLRNLTPVIHEALSISRTGFKDLDAVAVTRGPGLPAALMAGLKTAEALAYSLRKPLVTVNHHEAHLYSPWITGEPPRADFGAFEPSVSLIVSGGHTILVLVEAELRHRVLGSTIDDAAGECFDKIAKLIGLPYPGGPLVDRLAKEGDPRAHDFPRPMIRDETDDFSFSGLKTSVRYFLEKRLSLADDPKQLRDLCASVQAAIVETLVAKTIRAALREGVRCVTASGGVTCNTGLRELLAATCRKNGLTLRLASRSLCTDNAAMIGILAERMLMAGRIETDLDAEGLPSWPLGSTIPAL